MVLFHVKKHPLRHKMPHVAAFFHALADEGGRNLQNRGFQNGDGRMINKVAAVVTLAGKNEKFVIIKNFLVVAPILEILQTVHATNENKLKIRILL